MRNVFPLAALLLAACGGDADGTQVAVKDANGQDVVAIGRDGRVAIDTGGFKAAIDLPGIRIDPATFDIDGVRLPEGSTIDDVTVTDRGSGRLRLAFRAPNGAEAVRDWFATRLAGRGYTLRRDGDRLVGTDGEGQGFVLSAQDAGDGASRGTIELGRPGGR